MPDERPICWRKSLSLSGVTKSSQPTELYIDKSEFWSAGDEHRRIVVPPGCIVYFKITLMGARTDLDNEAYVFSAEGAAQRNRAGTFLIGGSESVKARKVVSEAAPDAIEAEIRPGEDDHALHVTVTSRIGAEVQWHAAAEVAAGEIPLKGAGTSGYPVSL